MHKLAPFMGLKHWDRVGLSVAESAKRLQRIAYIDRRLMSIEAGHMAARPEYELKGALAKWLWQDATFVDQLRNRCKQLRMGAAAFDKCPDEQLQQVMDKVLDSGSTLDLLTALCEVIKPALIDAIQGYLNEAQPLVDEPTIHMLRHQLIDREHQLAWGHQALEACRSAATQEQQLQALKWLQYIQALLTAAGGVDGTAVRHPLSKADIVAAKPFQLPERSTRDSRFRSSAVKFEELSFEDNDEGRFKMMLYSRYFEMTAAEAVAVVHFQAKGKPWEFYLDTARHVWDEVRHAWFGEAALRTKGVDLYEVPNWVGWYAMTTQLFDLDEAYIHLTIAIEKAAMKYPPGKREEWEFCRDIARDPLMTTFQDFDWADEVVHAGYGQRWIIEHYFEGDTKRAIAAAEETMRKRERFMEELAAGQSFPTPRAPFAGEY